MSTNPMLAFANLERVVLKNVSIFKTGTHTDSKGLVETFDQDRVRGMVQAFFDGIPESVPIKLGHVSAEFAKKVADALGIPTEVLIGEGDDGKGAARLGEVTALHSNGTMTADLALNPKVANLITEGFFTQNSPEIILGRKVNGKEIPAAIVALSLLGAQRPAIKGNDPLQASMSSEYNEEDGTTRVILFHELNTKEQWEPLDTTYEEGSTRVNRNEASTGSPEDVEWVVPIRDLGRGTFVQASVSAPNEATAKNVALRVVENFLFNVSGPLGKVIGGTLGVLFARKLVVGKPFRGIKGGVGNIAWKLSEEGLEGDEVIAYHPEIHRLVTQGNIALKTYLPESFTVEEKHMVQKLAVHAPEGISDAQWTTCLEAVKASGAENPEQTCREKLMEEGKMAVTMTAIAKSLALADDACLEDIIAAVGKLKTDQTQYEERFVSLETRLLESKYMEIVKEFQFVPGTPAEMTKKLVDRHLKFGEEEATEVINGWKALNQAASDANVTRLVLSEGDGEPAKDKDFIVMVNEYQEANKETAYKDCLSIITNLHPRAYQEYRKSVYTE